MVGMTRLQLESWKKTPLAVNTQPDISRVGNREVQDMCVREGCWLRSDSILNIEEPLQVEMLANRPPWLAVRHGGWRDIGNYDVNTIPQDAAGIERAREKSVGSPHVTGPGPNSDGSFAIELQPRIPDGERGLASLCPPTFSTL